MSKRLPPLNALRAFEAAGRHVSFTKAAEELFVTPGAISRQIKLLEDVLGLELFERTSRDLRIPDEAREYSIALGDAFEQINRATKRLMSAHRARSLRIHCPMTFTLRWLMPRLPLFHRLYPTRQIQLTTTLLPMPANLLHLGDADVVIQMGKGDWPDLIAHRLADSALVPVCSQAYLSSMGGTMAVEKLNEATLLCSMARPDDWRDWLDAAGGHDIDDQRGLHFESSSLAYQAAIEGIGIAIGQISLIAGDLVAGRLVAPFDFVHDNGNAYYLTYARQSENDSRLMEFRDWIMEQVVEFEAWLAESQGPAVLALKPNQAR
ncbi:transcriptional regulator GcvA [Mesorhizobium sp. 1M-11]|uniref:transcriptional regulator GcvA n=1 Tax=Mesorhizobium sp. 1M-11 TaxID=1529006 RepID=UPI000A9C8F4E|nr:transcriptional regulator GcvA [Mesorhizobium sp. 1M-11]